MQDSDRVGLSEDRCYHDRRLYGHRFSYLEDEPVTQDRRARATRERPLKD